MPDSKITALTSISTSTDPANDPLVIVDVSDTSMASSGTTKKVTLNQLLGASGTATLASATISGDLTVDTNVLKVDTTNNRVGVGTAAPISLAQFSGATPTIALSDTNPSSGSFFNLLFRHTDGLSATYNIATIQGQTNGNGGNGNLLFFTAASNSNTERYKIASDGVATWSNVGGVAGTAMTLNATGLGIGVTPSAKLHVEGSGPQARFSTASAVDARHEYYRNGIREGLLYWDANLIGLYATQSSGELVLASANTIRVRINSAGDTISNVTATPPTLATNRQMVFNLTSDTNLRISVRGTDGTTRTANITLA